MHIQYNGQMMVSVYEMRELGVAVPKRRLEHAYRCVGWLEIYDRQDEAMHRHIKLARILKPDRTYVLNELYEPHIVWANDNRLMLTGFERKKVKEDVVEYAQSWLCLLGDSRLSDPPADVRGPRSFNKRP